MRKLLTRNAFLAAALIVGACASDPSPAPVARAPAPPPEVSAAAPGVSVPTGEGVAAPGVTLPPEPPPPVRGDESLTVPGGRERPVEAPEGDPRTEAERMRDIRRWDECVMRQQGASEGDALRPQLTSPEEVCSRQLGMASRRAVPEARRNRP